jgi:ribosome-associated translation inhibitor RaiA
VTVHLEAGTTISVERVEMDLYDAITQAVSRAERRTLELLRRERQRGRRLGLGILF